MRFWCVPSKARAASPELPPRPGAAASVRSPSPPPRLSREEKKAIYGLDFVERKDEEDDKRRTKNRRSKSLSASTSAEAKAKNKKRSKKASSKTASTSQDVSFDMEDQEAERERRRHKRKKASSGSKEKRRGGDEERAVKKAERKVRAKADEGQNHHSRSASVGDLAEDHQRPSSPAETKSSHHNTKKSSSSPNGGHNSNNKDKSIHRKEESLDLNAVTRGAAAGGVSSGENSNPNCYYGQRISSVNTLNNNNNKETIEEQQKLEQAIPNPGKSRTRERKSTSFSKQISSSSSSNKTRRNYDQSRNLIEEGGIDAHNQIRDLTTTDFQGQNGKDKFIARITLPRKIFSADYYSFSSS